MASYILIAPCCLPSPRRHTRLVAAGDDATVKVVEREGRQPMNTTRRLEREPDMSTSTKALNSDVWLKIWGWLGSFSPFGRGTYNEEAFTDGNQRFLRGELEEILRFHP
jgi:hypothetical protein